MQHSEHGESLKPGMQKEVAHILVVLTVPISHFSLCDIFTTKSSTSANSWIHFFFNFLYKVEREIHDDLHNELC